MANIRFFGNITPQAVQFENASGTETGRIGKSGDDLTITNAVGDVLFGDGLSDVYIGNGISSVDLLFEQSGAISAAAGSSITLTIGSADTTLALYAPTITNISTQASESTALMINGSNVVGTRELGSNAFNSAAYLLDTTDTFTGSLIINGDIRGNGQQLILNAGESYSYATGQTNEYVYANAESGLQINSSPDNWATGWAGRTTATINAAGGGSTLPGTLGVGGVITAPGGNSTEWNDAYDNKITTFTDSGTSTVTLTLTQQDGGTLSTSFSVPQGTVTGGPYLPLDGGTMTGAGNITMPDNFELRAGADSDLRIYHNGTNNFILNTVGNLNIRNTADDGNITFQSDDGSGGYTNYFLINGGSTQTQVYKDFRFQDDVKAKFGSGEDLEIYHDGSNSYIKDTGVGSLYIGASAFRLTNAASTENIIAGYENAQVDLYYDNSKKFETTSTGVTVTGIVAATGGDSTEWNDAYDNKITTLAFSGAGTTTLTLNQQDGGIVSNTFINPQGTVVGATSGNTNTITVSASNTSPIVTAVTAAVGSGSSALATGAQIQTAINTALLGVLSYQGTWNASTNSPTLASGTGTPGYYYIVSVAGSTNLDGITDWAVGDWAVFSDLATDAWQKIDNTQVGNVTGSGAAGRVAYWNSSSNITSDADLTFDGTSLTVGGNIIANGSVYVNWDDTSSNIYMQDSDSGSRTIHCNSNYIGFLNQASSWAFSVDDTGNTNNWYNSTIAGTLTVTGNQYFNGEFIEGDGKEMFRYSDSWLRINEDNDFTDGIYCGTGILRTDGAFQVGSAGTKFLVTAAGAVTAESTLTLDNGQIVLGGTGRIQGVDLVSAGTDAANRDYVDNAIAGVPQGTVTGSGVNQRLAFWNGTSSLSSDDELTWDGVNLNIGTYAGTGDCELRLFGSTPNNSFSTLKTTNGNLHIDSDDGHAIYLNYYLGGSTSVIIGNGAAGSSGTQFNANGTASFGGVITAPGGNSTEWNTAYDNSITAAAVTGTTTKTLTLTQQDAGTVTASWSDETGSNNYVTSASFNTGDGVLTLNRSGLSAVTVDLDGRYVTGSGTVNTLPKFTGTGTSIGNSSISDSGSIVTFSNATINHTSTGSHYWNLYGNLNLLGITDLGQDLNLGSTTARLKSIVSNAGTYQWKNLTTDLAQLSSTGALRLYNYGAGTLVSDASGNITVSSGGGAGGPYLPLVGGTMANTNLVTNMNADLLDGKDYTDFGATLATYGSTAGASGRIRITAPFNTNSGKMFQITVSIYSSYTIHTYVVGGYMYSTTNNWHAPRAVYSGTGTPDIVVGRDSNGKAYISIANGDYTGVRVHNMTRGYYTSIADTYDPWAITIDGTTPNSVVPSVYKTWTSGNDGAGSGLDADLLDGQQGSYYATAASLGNYLPKAGGVMSGKIGRSSAIVGFLEGSYNNVGSNSTNTNPIYTIGSSYNPASTSLSNMYGIGYTHAGDASFVSLTGATSWGLYVAADGDARVFLDGVSGNMSCIGIVYASGGDSTEWNTAYDNRITSLTTNGTSGAATLISNVLNIPQYSGGSGTNSWILNSDGGTPATVTVNNVQTVDFAGGANITTSISGTGNYKNLIIDLDTGGAGAGTYGSTTDGTKIDTITLDAYGRVTAVATGATGDITGITPGTGISGGGTSGTVTITNSAPNVTTNLTTSTSATTLTVNSSDGTNAILPAATTAVAGVMTGADKSKLNGIATGAQVNVATNLGYTTAATTGTVTSSTGTNATLPAATTSLAGLMTNADKTKLNGIATGATNVTNNNQITNGAGYITKTLEVCDFILGFKNPGAQTNYFSWVNGSYQASLGPETYKTALYAGDIDVVKVISNVSVTGVTIVVSNAGGSIWSSGSFNLTANTVTSFSPSSAAFSANDQLYVTFTIPASANIIYKVDFGLLYD